MRLALVAGPLAVCLVVLAACVVDDPAVSPDSGAGAPSDAAASGDSPTAEDAAVPADGATATDAADAFVCTPPGPPIVVFLDRAGGTWAPGLADSRVNATPLVSQATTVAPWSIATPSWTTLMACVAKKLAPFNVKVTDVDPGAAPHLEVVFAPGTLPLFSGATSNGPLTCAVVPNAVAFVSSGYAEANLDNGCAGAVSVVGTSLGLEPVVVCPDAMAFPQTSCATAGFTNAALACGTTTAGACSCQGGTTQNSFARLLAVTGPACL